MFMMDNNLSEEDIERHTEQQAILNFFIVLCQQ